MKRETVFCQYNYQITAFAETWRECINCLCKLTIIYTGTVKFELNQITVPV